MGSFDRMLVVAFGGIGTGEQRARTGFDPECELRAARLSCDRVSLERPIGKRVVLPPSGRLLPGVTFGVLVDADGHRIGVAAT